jgi:hypothetical protein
MKNGSAMTTSAQARCWTQLGRTRAIKLIVPRGVRIETQDPRTPRHVSEPVAAQIFTLPT